MVEMTFAEIDEVSGGLGWLDWFAIGDIVTEFAKGFKEGVDAAPK